jgi:hypothetical protein
MRPIVSLLVALGVAGLDGGCATGRGVSVYGRQVQITPRADAESRSKVQGELLAIEPGKIWVLGKERVVAVPLDAVKEVKVQRHSMTGSRVAVWSVFGALATGGALALACSTVEGNGGCGGVFLGVGATWALVGALAAPSLGSSSVTRLPHPKQEDLQPFARFPQGLPEGFDTSAPAGPR